MNWLLVAAVAAIVIAAALALFATISARRAARLAPIPRPVAPEPAEAPAEARPLELPAAPAPLPELSLDERRQRKEQDEAFRKEAYQQKKQAEARQRQERAQQEEERLRAEEERAAALALAEATREAELKTAEERRVQAEAGRTLADGLTRTRGGFMSRLNGLFGGGRAVDAALLGELEEVLFSADIGVKTASHLLEVARKKVGRGDSSDAPAIKHAIRSEIERIIEAAQSPVRPAAGAKPQVWMVVGVNGVGKTTTIGKLAAKLAGRHQKVVLGAADTFRAAATEQLDVWAERSGATLVRGPDGSDPGSVAFEAVKRGLDSDADVVLIDTAGRLHTKAPLMEELKKLKRVLGKASEGAPHEVILVLDSTNGQNAIVQARQFHEALGVTGIVLTKLDGTAKGGVIIGICEELKLPILYVGVGETVADLQPFEAHGFVEALFV